MNAIAISPLATVQTSVRKENKKKNIVEIKSNNKVQIASQSKNNVQDKIKTGKVVK